MQPSGTTELTEMSRNSPRICHALRGANFGKIFDFSVSFFFIYKKIFYEVTLSAEIKRELKSIIKTLKTSSKNEFYLKIYEWEKKHQIFLNERSDKPNDKGKYPYKHRSVRSAAVSIKRYYEYIFTYETYPELNIERTTNRIEGKSFILLIS